MVVAEFSSNEPQLGSPNRSSLDLLQVRAFKDFHASSPIALPEIWTPTPDRIVLLTESQEADKQAGEQVYSEVDFEPEKLVYGPEFPAEISDLVMLGKAAEIDYSGADSTSVKRRCSEILRTKIVSSEEVAEYAIAHTNLELCQQLYLESASSQIDLHEIFAEVMDWMLESLSALDLDQSLLKEFKNVNFNISEDSLESSADGGESISASHTNLGAYINVYKQLNPAIGEDQDSQLADLGAVELIAHELGHVLDAVFGRACKQIYGRWIYKGQYIDNRLERFACYWGEAATMSLRGVSAYFCQVALHDAWQRRVLLEALEEQNNLRQKNGKEQLSIQSIYKQLIEKTPDEFPLVASVFDYALTQNGFSTFVSRENYCAPYTAKDVERALIISSGC